MRISIFRRLIAALGILAVALAVSGAACAAPTTATAGGMRGPSAPSRAHSAAHHAVPKMPFCGIPACVAAALLAAPPRLGAPLLLSTADYAVGPDPALPDNAPTAEPPPPRSLLAR